MTMLRTLAFALVLPISACGWLAPYRMDIQQGNFVSQEMVLQLRRGMTRDQVKFLLGTPLVTDIFHANRWDYVYFLDRPGEERRQRRVVVFFEDDKLVRVEGDVVAATRDKEAAR